MELDITIVNVITIVEVVLLLPTEELINFGKLVRIMDYIIFVTDFIFQNL